MSNATISVVMATYNGSKYLSDQLDSLTSQSRLPDEILISDDCSTDDTVAILSRFKNETSLNVRIIRRERQLHFRENFLQTALEARSDFVAFCDQDDIWRHDKLERCAKYFPDPRVAMIVHPAETIDHQSKKIGHFRQGITKQAIMPPLSYDLWHGFWGFSIVFRRNLLDLLPIQDRFTDYIAPSHLISHDRWITFLAQMVGQTIEIDEELVKYRQHASNLFGKGSLFAISTGDELRNRTDRYIEIANQMLTVVASLDTATTKNYPLFDRDACKHFVTESLETLKRRRELYLEESRPKSIIKAVAALTDGTYRSSFSKKTKWRSFARDLQYLAFGSR